MNTADQAAAILTAANDSGVSVARSLVTGGPSFARDCRQIAVTLQQIQQVPLQRGAAAGGTCGVIPQPVFSVVFTADCYPAPRDNGNTVVLPEPDAITAWTLAFLADIDRLEGALLDLAVPGGCRCVTVGPGVVTGPQGGQAHCAWTVTITALE